MQPKRIPTKSRSALLLAVTVVAAGCGGATGRRAEPKLQARDARQLIALAQKVARDAPADGCAAQRDIAALNAKAHALAAAGGRVPLRLRAPLLAGVAAVAADAPACTPPAPTPAPVAAHPTPHGKPKGHEHGHHEGHKEKD